MVAPFTEAELLKRTYQGGRECSHADAAVGTITRNPFKQSSQYHAEWERGYADVLEEKELLS